MMRGLDRCFRKFMTRGHIGLPGREGFSLVEILMVLLILSIGILPVVIIQHRSRQEISESDRYTQAITIAQSQMERIKGQGFGTAAPDSGAQGQVNWVCSVTNIGVGLDRIEITARWQGDRGQETLTIADLVSMR
ncbi:MAG: prepilin-type N-terminal cleavage/methylation domain-containing protein [Gemmatimonadales bacterium]|nr:prepilin-type N-terminal cleavage/methylation domain-containing protein [Gemmatimonadales bacterium]